jgi:hypothetical protein
MAALITYTEQQAIRKISPNREQDYDQWAIDVQYRDLQKLLGDKMYQDLVQNSTDAKYVELLDGGTYEIDGFTYQQKGLKYVLAYFIYAEYSIDSEHQDTFAGFRNKNIPESQQPNYGEVKRIRDKNRELAFVYWKDIKRFLDDNTDTYEYWECSNRQKVFNPIITKI